MPVFSAHTASVAASLLLATQVSATTYLAPEQVINLPDSSSASKPLEWLGANSPYFAGPNVHGISRDVPEGCVVDQVAIVSRHGSRFPDSGAYAQWTTLQAKIANATFEASGSLAFLETWKPVLTNPSAQMSQESPTGYKEAYDLGYTVRTRYPDLYQYGSPFISWANLYPRVVQTARNFVRGFLGHLADDLATVITVNSTGSPDAFFDSLSPSDLCPAFVDGNGGTYATEWNSIYLPPITERLNALISGNLTLSDTDVSIIPYLCGYESQITGTLSPFCNVFSNAELEKYEYAQSLRYYYGIGPGEDLPSKMMIPFLNKLVDILAGGPGQNGTFANGTSFTLPSIITTFLNDGQLTELGAASGVWDDEAPLSGTTMTKGRKYYASHFVTQRGLFSIERLTCSSKAGTQAVKRSNHNKRKPMPFGAPIVARDTNNSTVVAYPSSFVTSGTAPASSATATSTPSAPSTPSAGNSTYVRILLNDAVYPLPSCHAGPGKSCLLDTYVKYVADKLAAVGSYHDACNVTNTAVPTTDPKGASFFFNLGESWLAEVAP
ncbi:acid phosphatase-like protein [Coleophoma cylindrospora]|uniref:3-phytase n=1 Tax=Coleophoma cylindrospora TaxID=1849047 RepID=A0A3D8SSP6_9HELO|nr:acid phosphatase-like protein [Coleophoma cylindrospora]